jgi:large subunit ribosomal protein L3
MKALIGQKVGMTQIFDDEGNVARVTLIQAGPCVVTQVKTMEKDGYNAVQIGYGEAKHQARPQMGHLKAANANAKYLREIRLPELDANEAGVDEEVEVENNDLGLKVGSKLEVTTFEVGDKVQITGTSKGKGFAGTVKRHNFATGPKTHGSHNYRAPGSIGSGYPEHVIKGMRMAGQMGNKRVTVRGVKVILVDAERKILAVRGQVPGPRRGIVVVKGL